MAHQGIVLVKRFTYRGTPEEYGNVYHFAEAAPTTDVGWKALVDGVAAIEKQIYNVGVKIVRAYCYADTDADSVSTVNYTALGAEIPGTLAITAAQTAAPGDAAVWIRWQTAKRNTKGKTVYLRKYFHPAWFETPNDDAVSPLQKTALQAAGTALAGGTGHFTGFTLCGPDGTAAGAVGVSQWVTTRTLKRRGKRPPS